MLSILPCLVCLLKLQLQANSVALVVSGSLHLLVVHQSLVRRVRQHSVKVDSAKPHQRLVLVMKVALDRVRVVALDRVRVVALDKPLRLGQPILGPLQQQQVDSDWSDRRHLVGALDRRLEALVPLSERLLDQVDLGGQVLAR
jgi:hypothetical protein